MASAAAAIALEGSRPSQRPGHASSLAARKNGKQPLRAGKRRLTPRNTSSPEPLTPALCAEFTTADRNMRGPPKARPGSPLIIPCNCLASVAAGAFWGKKYSRLISKGQHNFADVLTAFHVGMGGTGLRKWKGRIDQRLDAAGSEKWQHVLFDRLGDSGLIRDRAGA